MVNSAENERRNMEAGLVSEDVAKKYIREHEEREAKVRELLDLAQEMNERVETATKEGKQEEALRLEVAALRAQVQALIVHFQVGEEHEDEPET